ncbi:MAG TPA: pitrilysin family protein [Gemmatimonadaceae bacterium]|nr:pitrilysin family protein [Gemmatimonadaceae bacterium]
MALPVQGQRAELEKRILRTILPNGLEVIVVPNPGVPLVTIEAAVRNGSFTQSPEYAGLSHLYEHMIFKANADYPQPDEFINRASELGAVFNAETREEVVNYYITLPKDSVEGGMRFMASALKSPLFRRDELERERAVVIGEYDRNESNPFFEFTKATGKALWGSAWSRKDPLGERSVILSTTPEKMRFIQQRYYVPNNTALIVAGDVTPERAFALARATLGDWKRGADPFVTDPIPPTPVLQRDTALITEVPIGTAILQVQWSGPSASKDPAATYAADVFSDVLNSPNSKFQQRLVDSGLFESIGVNYYTLNQVGPITIQGEVRPEKLRQALAALDDELRKVVEPGYITARELEDTKQHRIVDAMFQLEKASGFASQLSFWWAVTGLDYFYGYVDTMARQSPEDLRRYATTYILGKPRVVAVALPAEARAALRLTTADLLARRVRP